MKLLTAVAATANPDKLREIILILGDTVKLLPRPVTLCETVEDGQTLLDNARLKGTAVSEATGLPAVADDTGLEIDALAGAPGIYSARFAGENATYEENIEQVLAELDGIPGDERTARFRTVALIRWPDTSELIATGTVEGRISLRPHGDFGFGYDPIFIPSEGHGETFAEMGEAKHLLSHRGRAFRSLGYELLGKVFPETGVEVGGI